MSLTLKDLKKLELPVRLVSIDNRFCKNINHEITVTAFNSRYFLHSLKDGTETSSHTNTLRHYKLAPRIKIVEREYWVNVYFGHTSYAYHSRRDADKGVGMNRLFCKHIKLKYEVDADTGAFIREIE